MKQDMQQIMNAGVNYWEIPGLRFDPKRYDISWRKEKILDLTCSHFKISREELFARTRRVKIVTPRQIAIHLIHKYAGLNKSEIARLFNQNHTTILIALRRAVAISEFDESMRASMSVIENGIFS